MIKLFHEKSEDRFSYEDAKAIGDELGLDWNVIDSEQFHMGVNVETEHDDVTGGDPLLIGRIAWAHLREVSDYYTKLKDFVEND